MSRSVTFARLLRHPVASSESLESSAILIGTTAFVVSAIVATLTFWGRYSAISGRGSVGQFVALGSAVAALAVFVTARALVEGSMRSGSLPRREPPAPDARLHWYDIGALSLAHAIIALLGWIGVADLLKRSFTDAVLYTLSAAVLAGVAIAVTSYAVFLSAVSLSPMLLSLILAVFVVVGAFASMLSATDPHWWQENLSTLGISDDLSALAFNLTLVIAGVIITTIAHLATATIPVVDQNEVRGRNRVRSALILIGILLACVGIFPLDRFFTVHGLAASGMVAVFVAMVVGLRWLVPAIPRVFLLLGYFYVFVIVVLAVFYITGYYNLTAVELVAVVLVFSWLIVFIRTTGAMHGHERDGVSSMSH